MFCIEVSKGGVEVCNPTIRFLFSFPFGLTFRIREEPSIRNDIYFYIIRRISLYLIHRYISFT